VTRIGEAINLVSATSRLPESAPSALSHSLEGFRNLHQGETIIVCGCGKSLAGFADHQEFITIGVNDVGRLFQPTYLVVLNPRSQFTGDRFQYVEQSSARVLFTQLNLGINHPQIVRFNLGQQGGVTFDTPNVLPHTRNSPYVAVCLAALMGAKQIGVIGVDFTDDHFFGRTGRHSLANQLATIDEQYRRLEAALRARGVSVVNLSGESRLTAFRKEQVEKLRASQIRQTVRPGNGASAVTAEALKIISYATTPVAGVPAILARCISAATPHDARCVWARCDYGNGVVFEGDVEWTRAPAEAKRLIGEADLVIVHNGKVDPAHRKLLAQKPIVTLAHNYRWNVDTGFVDAGFPGVVVGQYQATLPEFSGWSPVPNPVPLWESAYQAEAKPDVVTIAYTPSGRHESYPPDHKLYWHGKGYETTTRVLHSLAGRYGVRLQTIGHTQISHAAALSMKRDAHIVIDECVTGSYHRNSLEGLALGCVVINGLGLRPLISEMLGKCAGGANSPFVFAHLETLAEELERLIALGPASLTQRGAAGRKWMEQHWQFAAQWDRYWQPAIDAALARGAQGSTRRLAAFAIRNADTNSIIVAMPHRDQPRAHGIASECLATTNADEKSGSVTMQRAIDSVSVVIPHGGADRLPLLAATLATLRERAGIGEIIVVELGSVPLAKDIAERWADKHLFIEHSGAFERARALNAGTTVAACELLLWHDNDLLIPPEFVPRAATELRERHLDFLIPYTEIRYLSEPDSAGMISGRGNLDECTSVNTMSAAAQGGAMGLVRREFLERCAGLIEGFHGWGGEDNAWNHKARLFGRAACTVRNDQQVYHLFHRLSGGYRAGIAGPANANPHYAENVARMNRVLSMRSASQLSRDFPPAIPATGILTRYNAMPSAEALRRTEQKRLSPYEQIFASHAERYRHARCESLSGPGSSLEQTRELRERLPSILEALGVQSLLDAPCGDLNWMKHVRLPVQRYIGVDVLGAAIAENKWRYASEQRSFIRVDLIQEQLPSVDAILCRDLLTHLTFAEIFAVLRNFKFSGATFLLTTTFTGPRANHDTSDGNWRTLNFTAPPFNFPQPRMLINENCTEAGGSFGDKSLGVWNLSDLLVDNPSMPPRHEEKQNAEPCPAKFSADAFTCATSAQECLRALPVWTYWEGPCPEWILACRRTIAAFAPRLVQLTPEGFEKLWDRDRDIDLSRLHAAAHRADFIRAFLLWRYGGLWIDADCLVMQSLQGVLSLLDEYDFVGHRERSGLVSNGFIGARPQSRIAAAFYERVCKRLRSGRPLGWTSIGSEPLSAVMKEDPKGWHELPRERVQPICWSQPERFFEERQPIDHERVFDPLAICYMMSNVSIKNYCRKYPQYDLMKSKSFFSFLLCRALGETQNEQPNSYERIFSQHGELYRRARGESLSGPGSSLDNTKELRERLPLVLEALGVRTLLDAPCGDLNWMKQVRLPVERYIGVDVLREVIAENEWRHTSTQKIFIRADLTRDDLPLADAILCRDLLPHLSFAEIFRVLRNFKRSGAAHLLTTTFTGPRENRESSGGNWRTLNLNAPPFNFPPPKMIINENCTEGGGCFADKSVGVWNLSDLPVDVASVPSVELKEAVVDL
jgi:hypothetical protein